VFITECYAKFLGDIGGEKAHHFYTPPTRAAAGSRMNLFR